MQGCRKGGSRVLGLHAAPWRTPCAPARPAWRRAACRTTAPRRRGAMLADRSGRNNHATCGDAPGAAPPSSYRRTRGRGRLKAERTLARCRLDLKDALATGRGVIRAEGMLRLAEQRLV